jgi:hypothetical protein
MSKKTTKVPIKDLPPKSDQAKDVRGGAGAVGPCNRK